ncbi:uncharacterized protein LOC131178291 [Hevea brasiliensis]|uniref:uncharacterized protein LOC131178291 n=1 Tax=Hevea brasiliensis TaxID=3981 RepID=UPI0025CB799E|nr:uncharacterized protein LOC131178291 [Hevea brasiliensis]
MVLGLADVPPGVSHLLFVDDSFFFFWPDVKECHTVKYILATYEGAFGQAINFQKSGIFFSANTSDATKFEAFNILDISTPLNHGRYSGLPFLIVKNKKQVFAYLKEWVWKRICSWKGVAKNDEFFLVGF